MPVRGFIGSLKFWLAAALILICQPAFADKRVALVLGNSAYQNVPPLTNPVNDAALMADTFRKAGFDLVYFRQNLSAQDTRRLLRDFADKSADADIAVIYYAGHGIEVDGSNYLIPVDARLERDNDVYDEAFSLDRILVAVEPAKRLRLVILDACRDNPFAQTMKKTVATRAIGRGLAKVEPASPNTLIAYSAKAGSTAQDGGGSDSPFTTALANHLTTPGLDVRRALGFVRDDVLKTTGNRQEPYVYGSLGGDDVPLVPGRSVTAPAPAPDAQAEIRRDYELALQVGNKAAFEAFLAQHPADGFYASLAKLQLDKLAADQAHAVAVEKSRQAEAERARLAAAGAQKEAQARADADARAAEQVRIDAEQAKQVAQQQAADAERKRIEAAAANPPAPAPVPGEAAPDKNVAVVSLDPAPSQADIAKSVQSELRRVGCYAGNADGDWDSSSQRSLSQFNRHAGTKLDVKTVNADTLDAIKQQPSRVCPLVCEHGFKADDDHCTRITCAEGFFINDDNECEKQRKQPVARRDEDDRASRRFRRQENGAGSAAPRGGTGYGYDAGVGALPPRNARSAPTASGSTGRPLTGLEREVGCNTPGAIMSGRCP
ncbi:MAG: caspase family protein [Bradyrhizobium sp.]|nr:caspase family protein [Bradyrhizobium sp.]